MKIFLNALSFLTIFKVPEKSYIDQKIFYKTLYYFPFAGFLIGLFSSSVFFIAGFIFPGFLCIIIAVLTEVILSGGMHIDGLADTSDGIFSGKRDKKKIIEIMKKSDIGAFGVISIVFLFILKIALAYGIFIILAKNIESFNFLENIGNAAVTHSIIYDYFSSLPSFNLITIANFTAIFSLMPAFSRWTINFQFARFAEFSSSGSLTDIFLENANKKTFFIASVYHFAFYILFNALAGYFLKKNFLFNNFSITIIQNYPLASGTAILFVIIPVLKSIIIILLIILFSEIAGRFFIKRIGRLSGDAIGAVVEMTEIIYLFLVYIFVFVF